MGSDIIQAPALNLVREEIEQLGAWAERPLLRPSPRARVGRWLDAAREQVWRLLGLEASVRRNHEALARVLLLAQVRRVAPHFQLLPDRDEWAIFYDVLVRNEYRLPDFFGPDDVLIDVGAHVGCFCLAALLRGARHLHAYEPDRVNFRRAAANLGTFGNRVQFYHQAVWRSDRSGDRLFHPGSLALSNTGGGSVVWQTGGDELDVVAFDDAIRRATGNGARRVRLVKMDCEVAEFPILLTSGCLHLIDAIHGEFHEVNDGVYNHYPIPPQARVEGFDRFTIGALAAHLGRAGFDMVFERRRGTSMGHFFATRAAAHARAA